MTIYRVPHRPIVKPPVYIDYLTDESELSDDDLDDLYITTNKERCRKRDDAGYDSDGYDKNNLDIKQMDPDGYIVEGPTISYIRHEYPKHTYHRNATVCDIIMIKNIGQRMRNSMRRITFVDDPRVSEGSVLYNVTRSKGNMVISVRSVYQSFTFDLFRLPYEVQRMIIGRLDYMTRYMIALIPNSQLKSLLNDVVPCKNTRYFYNLLAEYFNATVYEK